MATIYGTPVILLKKPDTSEQWLINSTVNPSYFGEDKDFNVEFTSNSTSYSIFRLGKAGNIILYGGSTVVCTGGNMQDAYRQIALAEPATGELLTWLEANAVKLPLTGTWVFNSRLTTTAPPLHTDVAFISNGTEFTNINTGINTGGGNLEPVKFYSLFYNDTRVIQDAAYQDWDNEAYRTITFTQPVQYQGNEEFVKWFTANAKQLPAKGKTLNEYTWD